MMSPDERLAYMANQIARNFAALGEEPAIAATADHLASFWEQRMLAKIDALSGQLEPIAAAAVERLDACGAPAHQRLATASEGSDAG